MPALYTTSIKSLPLVSKGKVRDVYALDDDKLLMITTDRLSAFDVVMGESIPEKGIVLNQMANFWFEKLQGSRYSPYRIELLITWTMR